VDIEFGHVAGSVASIIVIALMLVLYIKGKPFFKKYRELLKNVKDGWASMALATFMIYFLLIFSATYPMPLIQRTEYLLSYAALSVTLLTVYVVFIISLIQRKQLCDLNEQLINEKKWHKIAYEDALTGLKNRMAYMENINNLERNLPKDSRVCVIMIDIDNFKNVNDTMGHKAGDELLKNVATALQKIFFDVGCVVYRVGGDEFVVIALEVAPEYLKSIIDNINKTKEITELGCSVSAGCSDVDLCENNAFERAFARADEKMYIQKTEKKAVF
jgi:diguanylate cyclase (GGDEF)-like protein